MATAADRGKSVGESSLSMAGNGHSANYGNDRFASVADSDDHDDVGGGVVLRDFDDDDNNPPSVMDHSSGNAGAHANGFGSQNLSSAAYAKPTSANDHKTVASIGAGRFQEYNTANGNVSEALDASIDALVRISFSLSASSRRSCSSQAQGKGPRSPWTGETRRAS